MVTRCVKQGTNRGKLSEHGNYMETVIIDIVVPIVVTGLRTKKNRK